MDIKAASLHLERADPLFIPVMRLENLPKLPAPTAYLEALVDALVSQQLSVKAAATIFSRVKQTLNFDITTSNILSTPAWEFRRAGLSGQKTSYLFAVAEAFAQNPELFANLHELADEEVIRALTAIKGVGVWTAQMFLMFTLLREDVFPIGDLGIRKAMYQNFFDGEKALDVELVARAEIWRPHRSVACLWLWKSI